MTKQSNTTNTNRNNRKNWKKYLPILMILAGVVLLLLLRQGRGGDTTSLPSAPESYVQENPDNKEQTGEQSGSSNGEQTPLKPEVTVEDNTAPNPELYSKPTAISDPDSIPDFSGEDAWVINDGLPNFTSYEIDNWKEEKFSELDDLGRCGTAMVLLYRDLYPTGEREDISQVKPSGWKQAKYADVIEDEMLYNRSHLIAYAMTGQNANPKNLITGTQYMNQITMQHYEKKVLRYLDDNDCHVLYRVTPLFEGKELVARGVEMEAYSVEDAGESICFHVFLYNYQPGITIDYKTGKSQLSEK